MKVEKIRLGDVADVITKGTTPTSIGYEFVNKGINFIKIESITEDGAFIEDKFAYITDECNKKLSRSRLQENDILFSIAGAIGRVAIVDKNILPANTNQALAIIRVPKGAYEYNFLKYILKSPTIIKQFEKQKQGVAQINLSLKNIGDFEIPVISIEQQKKISLELDKMTSLIDKRKKQLEKLDELVKSRFIEMFGDPTITDKNRTYMPMTSICEIIDGDRGKNYPKQEEFYDEGYCLFLNARNVTSNGFDFTNRMFITEEKDKLLRKGKLSRGDVVLTTRGTIGNLAYYSDDVTFDNVRINSGMVILRMNHELVNEIFFVEQFKLQLAEIKEKVASGSAQPQLPISTMNKIQMLIPEISKQKDFVSFVKQTDKSKFEIKQSLEKIELLKKALMQKYFG